MTPPHDLRYTGDWAAAREKEMARRAATETRRAEEAAERQVASRQAYAELLFRWFSYGRLPTGSLNLF
jgi:hypothetical protein